MKNLLLIFSVLLSTSLSAVEYGQLAPYTLNDTISLNAGDIFKPLAYSSEQSGVVLSFKNGEQYSNGNDVVIELNESITNGNVNGSSDDFTLVGPGIITVYRALHYKLTRASEMQYQNGNIVSVPSDVQGAGTHNIVVETSSDLLNWTPVHSSAISGGSEAFI